MVPTGDAISTSKRDRKRMENGASSETTNWEEAREKPVAVWQMELNVQPIS
ncbi:hypothetical protein [aff. Roholtiella sp. LEGE 12411]|uniref:hypothetical protein n=1 Tax=aff. Roholtiella sp. LEGE 12411 TaxID=1828822 RepID=UPI00187FBE59|nr:hypothetical protein [aff. Roholtiella sp. LEGE 12411]MBE9037799.1 hypothetical protein [aff. Roholtiella sp. LEGE 12411]